MNEVLNEAFRHGAWATKALIGASKGLAPEELKRPAPGFGSILATLNHVVLSDAGYATMLTGVRPAWATDGNETDDLDQLEARVNETARLWEELLARPLDGERLLVLERGQYECRAAVVVLQALHHGAAHREQVRAALAPLGVKPPDVQAWAYADATGRARWRDARPRTP
jgi:uncharacterized damage-inducible protein DinB